MIFFSVSKLANFLHPLEVKEEVNEKSTFCPTIAKNVVEMVMMCRCGLVKLTEYLSKLKLRVS